MLAAVIADGIYATSSSKLQSITLSSDPSYACRVQFVLSGRSSQPAMLKLSESGYVGAASITSPMGRVDR